MSCSYFTKMTCCESKFLYERLMSPYTGGRVNSNHKRFASCVGYQWRTLDPRISQATPPPTDVLSGLNTRSWPISRNGLVLAIWYHTPGTAASPLGQKVPPMGAYTWHWRIDVLLFFVWRRLSYICFMKGSCSKVVPMINDLPHVLDVSAGP